MNEEILNVLFSEMWPDARAVLCSVSGDPGTVKYWPGIAWDLQQDCELREDRNNYVAVSSFTALAESGQWRRRKETFDALHVVMVDDIGTKIDPIRFKSVQPKLAPTLVVETSPGNFQASFKLTEPQRDADKASDLIDAVVTGLTNDGIDPGMAGVTRVMRLPGGVNGKPKYAKEGEPWRCRVVYWKPEQTTSFDQLAEAFAMVSKHRAYTEPADDVSRERKRGFEIVLASVRSLGLVTKVQRGWVDVRCPWVEDHTDRASTGSAIAYPSKANGYMGGYRCHHGHCTKRGWSDFENWVATSVRRQGQAVERTTFKAPK